MAHDSTMTEQDMDSTAHRLVQNLRGDAVEFEPDLAVDGLSESIVSRLFRILTFRRR